MNPAHRHDLLAIMDMLNGEVALFLEDEPLQN
jgi:hypothetical protein